MKNSAIFRAVGLRATEHLGYAFTQTTFLSQSQKELYRFVGNAIFRIIEVNSRDFGGQTLTALGIVGKELPQMYITDRRTMRFERLPRRALCQR